MSHQPDESESAPRRIDRSRLEDERDERTGRARPPERIRNQTRWVDLQVREAMERGEFDDLPGAGKPLDLPRQARPRLVGEAAHRAREDHRRRAARDRAAQGGRRARRLLDREATPGRRTPGGRGLQRPGRRGPPPAHRAARRSSPRTRDVEAEVEAWRERRAERRPRRRADRRDRSPAAPPTACPLVAKRRRPGLGAARTSRWVSAARTATTRVGSALLHRDPHAALGGDLGGPVVAGVDVPDHAHARVVGQHPLDLLRGQVGAVGDA